LIAGQCLAVHGKVEAGMGGLRQLVHPEFEILQGDDANVEKILPVYEHPSTVPLSLMRKWVSEAIIAYRDKLASHLPLATIQRQKLIEPIEALVQLHQPPPQSNVPALIVSPRWRIAQSSSTNCFIFNSAWASENRKMSPAAALS